MLLYTDPRFSLHSSVYDPPTTIGQPIEFFEVVLSPSHSNLGRMEYLRSFFFFINRSLHAARITKVLYFTIFIPPSPPLRILSQWLFFFFFFLG